MPRLLPLRRFKGRILVRELIAASTLEMLNLQWCGITVKIPGHAIGKGLALRRQAKDADYLEARGGSAAQVVKYVREIMWAE